MPAPRSARLASRPLPATGVPPAAPALPQCAPPRPAYGGRSAAARVSLGARVRVRFPARIGCWLVTEPRCARGGHLQM